MKVTVIGSGYVGLVTGACLAELGNSVMCLDLDQEKINLLNSGGVPIFEPGLDQLIQSNMNLGRIQFTSDIEKSVAHGDIQFIAVGTPPDGDSRADLQYVISAAKNIAKYMSSFKVIVNKSTVPVGTAKKVSQVIADGLLLRGIHEEYSVISNPEFLKEGAAIDDFMRPDRIVIGYNEDKEGIKAREMMRQLYAPFNRNHERTYFMDVKSAELTKYAANAMLATRISFMNELANLADDVGADIEKVRLGIGSDSRIGFSFLYAGTGYGGSCFPKDVNALIMTGRDHGHDLNLLSAVESVNKLQKSILVKKVINEFGTDLSGKIIAIWGLAFKPNTNDMRDAPSRVIIKSLLDLGAIVQAHDPVAINEAKKYLKADLKADQYANQINFFEDPDATLENAEFLIIATEWKMYRSPDFQKIKQKLKKPVIFDGRNLYDPKSMNEMGFKYIAIGRHSSIN